ncbi:hypothetical protein LSAT2_014651 [Lamellibrachia satsuma]|nr:hypothetical protein LSAT2_014651 [Lamellibrachia satsuma]
MRDDPSVKLVFANVSGADASSPVFGAHALRVITGLDLCINALVDVPILEKLTSHLATQHGRRIGLKAKYFDMHLKATSDGLAKLVDNFNIDAWYNCMHPTFKSISSKVSP